NLTPRGLEPSAAAPIDPSAAAQAARAIAANPQNAPAILNQLQRDPNNRVIPPGYTFMPTDPSYSVPVHLQKQPGTGALPNAVWPPSPAQMQALEAFARQVRAQQNNPLSPMGMAIQLGKLENNPAHQQSGAIMGWILQAQQMAAQQDLQIGLEL